MVSGCVVHFQVNRLCVANENATFMRHRQLDVINMISKVDGLPDAVITHPGEPCQPAGLLYVNG